MPICNLRHRRNTFNIKSTIFLFYIFNLFLYNQKIKILFNSIIFILAAIISAQSFAASCNPNLSGSNIFIPNISFNRDMPTNSQIGSDMASTAAVQFNCDSSTSGTLDFGLKISSGNLIGTINGRSIYSTNINGIGFAAGIRVTSPTSCPSTIFWVDGSNNGDGNVRNRLACTTKVSSATNFSGVYYIALYKTAALTGSGTIDLTNRVVGILRVNSTWLPYIVLPGESQLKVNSFTTSLATCSVTNNGSVNLPVVSITSLPQLNSISGQTPFSLTLNCPGKTTVALTFTDKNNITQTGNILTADPISTVKGVGMQLRYSGSVISFGPDSSVAGNTNQIFLGAISGQQTISFNVAYIRTGTISAGFLRTAATFTLSYQ